MVLIAIPIKVGKFFLPRIFKDIKLEFKLTYRLLFRVVRMSGSVKIKYINLIISTKLVRDVAATVFKLRDNYVYVCVGVQDIDRDAEGWYVKVLEAGKILYELETENNYKMELVYDNDNEIISEIVREELERSRREKYDKDCKSRKFM